MRRRPNARAGEAKRLVPACISAKRSRDSSVVHVRRRGTEGAQPIREEARAARPVHLQVALGFLDPALRVASVQADLLDVDGSIALQIRHDEAPIVSRRAAFEPRDLGLQDHATLPSAPGHGAVAVSPNSRFRDAACHRGAPHGLHQRLHPAGRRGVPAERDGVLEPLRLEEVQHLEPGGPPSRRRRGRARVKTGPTRGGTRPESGIAPAVAWARPPRSIAATVCRSDSSLKLRNSGVARSASCRGVG